MAVRKEQHITIEGAQARQDTIRPRADRLHRFAAWTAIAKEKPVRPLLANVVGAPALVVAVVPLDEIVVELSSGAEAGQLARSLGALQWTGQHPSEARALETFAQAARVVFAVRCQRNVGCAGVLAGQGPFRLAMTREINLRKMVAAHGPPQLGRMCRGPGMT